VEVDTLPIVSKRPGWQSCTATRKDAKTPPTLYFTCSLEGSGVPRADEPTTPSHAREIDAAIEPALDLYASTGT
jgi:hypothetical protein